MFEINYFVPVVRYSYTKLTIKITESTAKTFMKQRSATNVAFILSYLCYKSLYYFYMYTNEM